MNKMAVWLVVAVVVIGGGWYLSTLKTGSVTEPGQTESNATASTETTGTSATGSSSSSSARSLSSLMARGGSYRCTFSKTTSTGRTDGTVYISGNRMRGDFSTSFSAGAKVDSHILFVSGTVYTWSGAVQQGFKAPATVSTAGTALGSSGSAGFDYNQPLNYSCQASGSDASIFEIPKGILFSNI